jgi:hypothetical protein
VGEPGRGDKTKNNNYWPTGLSRGLAILAAIVWPLPLLKRIKQLPHEGQRRRLLAAVKVLPFAAEAAEATGELHLSVNLGIAVRPKLDLDTGRPLDDFGVWRGRWAK